MGQELTLNEEIRKINLDAYESIYSIRPSIDPEEKSKYRVEKAKDGAPVLFIRISEGGISKWVPMNSTYSPEYEASRWAGRLALENNRTVLAVLGFGMGYHIYAMLNSMRPDTDFVIYEPEEGLFSFICGFVDITELIKEQRISIVLPTNKMGDYYRYLEYYVIGHRAQAEGIRLPLYAVNSFFDRACERISYYVRTNRTYNFKRGRKSLTNRIRSWTQMHTNSIISDLFDRLPQDIPIVIVAGGPSLNKNAALLSELMNRAIVVCIDRAVHTLESHGVIPDMLITMDVDKSPSHLTAESMSELPVICSFQANRLTQQQFNGRLIYFHGWLGEAKLPGCGERILRQGDVGGNVAGGAFSTFLLHKMKTIIFVGQDLAMLGNISHADGSDEGVNWSSEVMEVEGIDGKPVVTRADWVGFRNGYEQLIRENPGTRVIDATEGGALIHGSEVMTLRNVIDNVCTAEYDITGIINGIPKAQNAEEHAETIELLRNYIRELSEVSEMSKEVADISKQLLKESRYGDINDQRNARKLKRLEQLRSDIYSKQAYEMIEDEWFEERNLLPDREYIFRNSEEAIPVFTRSVDYYSLLPDNCDSLSNVIRDAIKYAGEDV